MKRIVMGLVAAAVAVGFAAPAAADPDTDFNNELHVYGIYKPKDYNAWIGKIMCKRMYTGTDKDVFASADFVHNQLDHDATTDQAYQFVAAAVRTYCPEKQPVLDALANKPAPQA